MRSPKGASKHLNSESIRRSLAISEQRTWSAVYSLLESEGKWEELIDAILNGFESLSVAIPLLPTRSRVALARALAFVGRLDDAKGVVDSLSVESLRSDIECVTYLYLAKAVLARREQNWKQSLLLSRLALAALEGKNLLHAETEARFSEAVSLSEMGEIFAAIVVYQSIRNDSRPISNYRRRLATLNECWCLWDTGQWQPIKELLAYVPDLVRPKIAVYLAALEDQSAYLESWLVHGVSDLPLAVNDREQIVMILSEWYALKRSEIEVQDLENTWLFRELVELRGANQGPDIIAKFDLCLALIGDSTKYKAIEWSTLQDWRYGAELGFLNLLTLAKNRPASAARTFRQEYSPFLVKHRLKTPLIPNLHDLENQTSPWAKLVAQHFAVRSLSPRELISGKAPHKLKELSQEQQNALLFNLQESSLKLAPKASHDLGAEQRHLKLQKSPTSCTLLTVLSGRRGKRVTKSELHVRLTGTTYRSEIHDPRLLKLLKRLNDKIANTFGFKAWTLARDNSVTLLVDISS